MRVYKMFRTLAIVCIVLDLDSVRCLQPLIVGGRPANMEYYGHSAFLSMESDGDVFVCGSSIINQNVVLSAAHCFEEMDKDSKIVIRVGNANKLRGAVRHGSRVAIHKDYDTESVSNDIALLYLRKPLALGEYVKRVILMKYPPKTKFAHVAGWGLVDERKQKNTQWLHQTQQKLMPWVECKEIIQRLPEGTICGGYDDSSNYASSGDSGSALVDGSIQIGLVSFKRPEISRGIVVYTHVPYFYDWIKRTTYKLYCKNQRQ